MIGEIAACPGKLGKNNPEPGHMIAPFLSAAFELVMRPVCNCSFILYLLVGEGSLAI
jgi:hypothetical protein